MREHPLYGGRDITPAPFTIPSHLQITADGVGQVAFDTFKSVADFDAGADAIPRLRVAFVPAPTEDSVRRIVPYSQVFFEPTDMEPYQGVIAAIREKALDIMGLGGRGYTLVSFEIDTVYKSISMVAQNGKGTYDPLMITGEDYDTTLAENMDLAQQVIGFAWAFGQRDPFLAAMAPV